MDGKFRLLSHKSWNKHFFLLARRIFIIRLKTIWKRDFKHLFVIKMIRGINTKLICRSLFYILMWFLDCLKIEFKNINILKVILNVINSFEGVISLAWEIRHPLWFRGLKRNRDIVYRFNIYQDLFPCFITLSDKTRIIIYLYLHYKLKHEEY